MARRRSLVRIWRRLRRPTFGRLVASSVVLHLTVITLAVWLSERSSPPPLPPSRAPLVVDLPPAAPGPPLVKPEVSGRSSPRVAAAPATRGPAPPAPARPALPPPSATPEAAPPPPPPVARPPEPPSAGPPPLASPAPVAPPVPRPPELPPLVPPVAATTPSEAASLSEPRPSLAAKAPAPGEASPPASPPAPPSSTPGDSPLTGRSFSLLGPRIEAPPGLSPPPSGSGGTRPEGSGAGEAGRERDGQVVVPLNTPDPKYAEYFLELKKRIEAHWVYPQDAIRRNQSGQGMVEFVLRKDGTVRLVEVVHSSGVGILDRYVENAIKLAAPFPPMPERFGTDTLPVSLNFTYVLGGFRLFGFR